MKLTKENIDEIINSNFSLDRGKDALTPEELEFLDTLSDHEIKMMIEQCNSKYNYFNAVQNGLKLILNSTYGAFGNKFFVCSTKDIANAITIMCRDTIKLMDKTNEDYWYNKWHEDYEIHEVLGVSNVSKIDDTYYHVNTEMDHDGDVTYQEVEDNTFKRTKPVSVYIDTDSCFVGFEPAMSSSNYQGDEMKFIHTMSRERLEPLFTSVLEEYAAKFNVKNIQDFELENINESILFVAKKLYIKHTRWEDGRYYDRLTNIIPKGVSLVKSGTPKFAREKLLYIIKDIIFNDPKAISVNTITKAVKKIRQEFEMADINDISQGGKVSNMMSPGKIKVEVVDKKTKEVTGYEMIDAAGIVSVYPELIFAKGTHFTRKAVGLYNHLLLSNPEYQNKYQLIKDEDKVKSYPTIHPLNDRFAFHIGEFPIEFAPPVNFEDLFEATFLKPLNAYLQVLGLPEINKKLRITFALFQ